MRVCTVLALIVLLTLPACGLVEGKPALTEIPVTNTPEPVYRATPVAQSPAAGICGAWEEDEVTFTILPDIPDPRCGEVRPGQTLTVVNQREEVIRARIGLFTAEIAPGKEHVFDVPLGEYLMPGVHVVEISPCCSLELVLKK
jgi:hypothetical protein